MKYAHRTEIIEQTAAFCDRTKKSMLLKSAAFSHRMAERMRAVLAHKALTDQQKPESNEMVSIPGS